MIIYIYRFKNGDTCPCCGQVITGRTPEELAELSVLIYGVATALGIADWVLRPGEDAIEISAEDITRAIGPGPEWPT